MRQHTYLTVTMLGLAFTLGLAPAGCGDDDQRAGNDAVNDSTTASDAADTGTGDDTSALDDGTTTTTSTSPSDATTPADTTTPVDTAPDPDAVFGDDHPRIYLSDDDTRARLVGLLANDNAAAERFKDMVDAQVFEGADFYEFSAADAALMYQLTGTKAYGDYAVAATEAWVAGEEGLIGDGDNAEVAYDSYLYVGPTIGDLALVYDWCFDLLTNPQRTRWLEYANQAVWNVWHPDDANWGGPVYDWTGWSLHNPSNNYYYSFLRATMLLGLAARGELPEAEGWITQARDNMLEDELFPTFTRDLTGGGSREGTGYGTAMRELFTLYDVWERSTGEPIADNTPHTLASLAYIMHATVPTLDYLAPTGDHARDSTAALFDYHRGYIETLRLLNRDSPLAEIATTYLADCSVPRMGNAFQFVHDFVNADDTIPARPLSDLYPAYYGSGTGHVYWRSGWQPDATYVTFITGPYTESHAHHDQSSFMIYGNQWLAYDQNFNSHSGIVQRENVHNLVTLERGGDVIAQREGTVSTLVSLKDRGDVFYLSGDVTAAYDDDDDVTAHTRDLVIIEPGVVVVFDRVIVDGGVRAVWHLNTPVSPSIAGGNATIQNGGSTLRVRPIAPVPGQDGATLTSIVWENADEDMNDGYRVDLAAPAGSARFLVVLDRDGLVTSADDDDEGGTRGVHLVLSDGRTAVVRFDVDTPGAHVQLLHGGDVVLDEDFGAGVDTLPLLRP